MTNTPYTDPFYSTMFDRTWPAAQAISRHVVDLVEPGSVVDFGCGVGTWLKAFSEAGVPVIQGFEGDWLDTGHLVIGRDSFGRADLSMPLDLGRTYDLAISLEVAEHIPSEAADTFMDNLTRHSQCVLFSAAIPDQGGTDHVNEQWQSHWINKFADRNYACLDVVRPVFWNDKEVLFWYRQNMFLFMEHSMLKGKPSLEHWKIDQRTLVDVVHPELLEKKVAWASRPTGPPPGLVQRLSRAMARRFKGATDTHTS